MQNSLELLGRSSRLFFIHRKFTGAKRNRTSVNGSSAFGASINILTDKISKDPFFESNNTFGSYNTFKNTLRFSTGLMNKVFEFSGRLSKIDSDGYIDRSTSDLKSYFLQFSLQKKKNTLIKFLNFWRS